MKTKISAIVLSLLMTIMLLPTAHASSSDWLSGLKDGAGELWNAAKDKGGEIIDTVREEGPGWIETGKEKVGEAVDKAGEVISDTQQKVSDWNADQQQQFWDRTEQMISGGVSTTPAPAPSQPIQADPHIPVSGATTPPDPADENIQATLDPDFVNRSEKIVSEWQGEDPQLEPTPDLSFVDRSDEFVEELNKKQAGAPSSQAPESSESIISSVPVVGDVVDLLDTLDEQPTATDVPSAQSSVADEEPQPAANELAGTLYYDGQWYREAKDGSDDGDLLFKGRTFAKTEEELLDVSSIPSYVVVLDGVIVQLIPGEEPQDLNAVEQDESPQEEEQHDKMSDLPFAIMGVTIFGTFFGAFAVSCMGYGNTNLPSSPRRDDKDQ